MQLVAQNLGFSRGNQTILRGITLTFATPGITALLGANGVGKTLLIKMLVGLIQPTEGAVQLSTFDRQTWQPAQQADARMQMGFQGDELNFWRNETVQQALLYTQALRQVDQCKGEYQALLEQCHLGDLQKVPLKRLSLGQQRRVAIALALVGRPSFIFLDEPTNALDLKEQDTMMVLFKQLSAHSQLIITSHRFNEVELLADRLLILKEGRLCHDAPLADTTPSAAQIYREYYHDAP